MTNKTNPADIAAKLLDPEAFAQEEQKRLAAQKRKKEAAEKDKLKKRAQPVKKYYDVKVECMLPGVVTYRVLAESPEQAIELRKSYSPVSVTHKLAGRKELLAKVYDASTVMLRFTRKLLGM